MCIAPVPIEATKENVAVWDSTLYINVPCGTCADCVRSRQASWLFRLQQQLRETPTAAMVTLTYMDSELPWDYEQDRPVLERQDLSTFCQILKKRHNRLGVEFKYFACGEYGKKEGRPHYHVITMSELPHKDIEQMISKGWVWHKGMWEYKAPRPDQDIAGAMNYVLKYMDKQKVNKWVGDPTDENEWQQMSQGIGDNYTQTAKRQFELEQYEVSLGNGQRIGIPRYYWKQVYGEKETLMRKPIGIRYKEKVIQADQEGFDRLGEQYVINKLNSAQARQKSYISKTRHTKPRQ